MMKNNEQIENNDSFLTVKSRILYQSSACVVVNKLIGESVEGVKRQSAVGNMIDLPKELSSVLGANIELIEAVHRLDVPVTGCVLFALTKSALTFLNAAFAQESNISTVSNKILTTEDGCPADSLEFHGGKENLRIKTPCNSCASVVNSYLLDISQPSPIEKIYWAVIEKPSRPLPESGEFSHWIETDTVHNKSYAHKTGDSSRKKAVMRYKVTGEGKNYLFLEVHLLSGRHHQIRAQLAAERLHIKGDLKYGAKRSEKSGGIRLHARSLSFPNPLNRGEIIRVIAPPPVMDNLWAEFG